MPLSQTAYAPLSSATVEVAANPPLAAGTVIDFCGEQATVLFDDGGRTISVEADGYKQQWYRVFEGVACTVVSVPEKGAARQAADLDAPKHT